MKALFNAISGGNLPSLGQDRTTPAPAPQAMPGAGPSLFDAMQAPPTQVAMGGKRLDFPTLVNQKDKKQIQEDSKKASPVANPEGRG